ncbi:MAG: M56 family metallopeptidase, partial [Alistipes sp.]
FSLVCTPHKIASFSFFRTIYVWDQTPAEEMTAIVAHEMSHITHHHSTERIAMECMKAALWWNPFVWIAARRLTEAEEFEADSDVIESGYDLENYMNTLFKQLFGYSPDIANGLRNSLTKKRFQMMTKSQKSRYSLLRLAATLPALIGLLCAFSFTTRAAVIRYADAKEAAITIKSDEKPNSNGQNVIRITTTPNAQPAPVEADEPFLFAETMPTFQGGDLNTFRQWVQTQLRYPAEALAKGIQGRVVLTFVIEKDGSVSNVKVLQSPDKILSDESIRILSHSPRWSAGKQRGEPVCVKYTLPVDFRTMKENSTTAGGKEETAQEKH